MAFGRQQLKSELIEQALELVHKGLEGTRAASAELFLRRFYDHVPPDEILGETPENLYGAALTMWSFAKQRKVGAPKIRVYNPRHESHGWKSAHTIVEVVNDDMPFLVDSVVAAVQGLKIEVHLVIHPVVHLRRDEGGRLVELHDLGPRDARPEGATTESMMQLQVSEQPAEMQDKLDKTLTAVLTDVRAAVDDWRKMRERCHQLVASLEQDPPSLPESGRC